MVNPYAPEERTASKSPSCNTKSRSFPRKSLVSHTGPTKS
ncbi:Uncharacterised protein [Vibrio cholerae]|nr:Uncharacterised protein [Vibrio cholerae]